MDMVMYSLKEATMPLQSYIRFNVIVSKANKEAYDWVTEYCKVTGKTMAQALFDGVRAMRAVEEAKADTNETPQ